MTKPASTEDLIREYDALTARKFNGGHADGGQPNRQRKINRICDELCNRADAGDAAALDWFKS